MQIRNISLAKNNCGSEANETQRTVWQIFLYALGLPFWN